MEALPVFLRSLKSIIMLCLSNRKKDHFAAIDQVERCIEDYHLDPLFGFELDPFGRILHFLETEKFSLLKADEELWRLRSQALWITLGDQNTRFFHNFANMRLKSNTIWEIEDTAGTLVYSPEQIADVAVGHFKKLFSKPEIVNLEAQMEVLHCMPRFFTDEDNDCIGRSVTLSEIEGILRGMAKDKSPGPGGWTVEFYLQFFDLFGPEIVCLVEEPPNNGRISGSLNATFIALIPKITNPISFQDFRPISLCNLLYKVISKVIADRNKDGLSRGISDEQFGFLHERLIFDAIGTAQETIHFVKLSRASSIVLKLDLFKAFDLVDWSFLRLLLLNAGLSLLITNWILGCITSVNFVVLVNGCPTPFFKGNRGLRQGFPLSPLLFLLVIEGISRLLIRANAAGRILGIKVSKNLHITNLFFVDDVLLFGVGIIGEWFHYKDLLDLFCKATGMIINIPKSCIYFQNLCSADCLILGRLFPFEFKGLSEGFKYLGYHLKPNDYLIQDWKWLIRKFKRKISSWYNRYMSLGDRLILLNSVLSNLLVYWLTLAKVPVSILNSLGSLSFNFLWSGRDGKKGIHLTAWHHLSIPRKYGGWGIRNIHWTYRALHLKSIWRALTHSGLWGLLVRDKYLKGDSVISWLRGRSWKKAGVSNFWSGLLDSIPILMAHLR